MATYVAYDLSGNKIGHIDVPGDITPVRLQGTDRFFEFNFSYDEGGGQYDEFSIPEVALAK